MQHDCQIGGQPSAAADGARFGVFNPADGALIASVADGGPEEARRAIDAAERALPAWAGLSVHARADILQRWYQRLIEQREGLAELITAESGKPLE